jgi:putative transcriptional regulator
VIVPNPKGIKAARLAAGLTQQEAADLVGLPQPRWSEYEAGKRRPRRAQWEMFLLLTGQHRDLEVRLRE